MSLLWMAVGVMAGLVTGGVIGSAIFDGLLLTGMVYVGWHLATDDDQPEKEGEL